MYVNPYYAKLNYFVNVFNILYLNSNQTNILTTCKSLKQFLSVPETLQSSNGICFGSIILSVGVLLDLFIYSRIY